MLADTDFTDLASPDGAPAAAPASVSTDAQTTAANEAFRQHVAALIAHGSKQDVLDYLGQMHVDPARVLNLDAAFKRRAEGLSTGVQLYGVGGKPPEPQPAQPTGSDTDFSDIATAEHPPVTVGREAGIAGRGALEDGLGGLVSLGFHGGAALSGISPLALAAAQTDPKEYIKAAADAIGLPHAEGGGEEMLQKVAGGVTSGALTGGLAPELGLLPSAISGGTSAAASEGVRQAGGGTAAQLAAGLVGGALPVGAVGGVRALAARGPTITDAGRTVVDAAAQEGVPISRPFVDPTVRNKVTYLETTKGGGTPIREGLSQTSDAIADRVASLGGDGTAVSPEVGGQKLQGAGMAFIRDSGKRSARLYTRAQALANGLKVSPTTAINTLDAHIADLAKAPETNKAVINYLSGLRNDLAQSGGLDIQTLRDIRTGIRGNINQSNLTSTNAERIAKDALSAASDDISSVLSPEARAAYKAADANYAERMGTINNVVKAFIGPRTANISPEKAFAKFQAMATPKGDNARLAAMLNLLPAEDRADIAATFAAELGKNGKGEFSPAFLASQAQKLPDAAAKNLFGDEGAASLRRLALISKEHAAIIANLNKSRTGVVGNYRFALPRLLGLVAGGLGGVATHGIPGGAIGGYAATKAAGAVNDFAEELSARALMNSDLTKWIAKAPATARPQAAQAYTRLLTTVAARNPAISNEVLQLQNRLFDAFSQSPSRAAAQEQDRRRVPVNQQEQPYAPQ